jgi:hypothetical protein
VEPASLARPMEPGISSATARRLPDQYNLRFAASAWTTTPTEGSRIRDVPLVDPEPVYSLFFEKTSPAAAPFRCCRWYGSFDPSVNIRPIPGRRVYPSAIPAKIHRRRHACELSRGMPARIATRSVAGAATPRPLSFDRPAATIAMR